MFTCIVVDLVKKNLEIVFIVLELIHKLTCQMLVLFGMRVRFRAIPAADGDRLWFLDVKITICACACERIIASSFAFIHIEAKRRLQPCAQTIVGVVAIRSESRMRSVADMLKHFGVHGKFRALERVWRVGSRLEV